MAQHYEDGPVEIVGVGDLKCHPLNIKLYAEHIDEDFKKSVQESGILVPLVVCNSETDAELREQLRLAGLLLTIGKQADGSSFIKTLRSQGYVFIAQVDTTA